MITRKRGVYVRNGVKLSEPEQTRCRRLGIPPAYTNVVVYAKDARLQATAVDGQGKTHYYYHEKYLDAQRKKRKARASDIDFSKIKSATGKILSQAAHPSWDDALALRMIASGYLRSGVAERETGALGAFSLERRHVKLRGDSETVVFDFPAKSGQRRLFEARDRVLHGALSKRRGGLLVGNAKYERVRDLLRKIVGNKDIQLKDIRTAGSMQLFQKHLRESKGDETLARKVTAETIGHTPAVSKKFYLL
jgi:DNA topoisomerase IB